MKLTDQTINDQIRDLSIVSSSKLITIMVYMVLSINISTNTVECTYSTPREHI